MNGRNSSNDAPASTPRRSAPTTGKHRLSAEERQRRRREAVRAREAERRSLAALHGIDPEPRVDAATVKARRAEMPTEDTRDLTARVFGDPNPADRRRR